MTGYPATAAAALALLLTAGLPAAAVAQTPDPHAGHTMPQPAPAPDPHAGHAMPSQAPAPDPRTPQEPPKDAQPLPPHVPPLTDADRAAAFPDVPGHEANDNAVHYLVRFDRLEWQHASSGDAAHWDANGWLGTDTTRLWFRTEGEAEDRALASAEAHVMYGRAFARWWDVVAGVRQDVRPGSPQTWAAIGVQGLAPYWFEVEATAYVGASGRTQARFEVDYELLITNRLVLQPLAELDIFGKADPERRVGAGLSTVEAGARLRYEIRREFAPYIGVTWQQKFGQTGDYAKADGEDIRSVRLAIGLRWWF